MNFNLNVVLFRRKLKSEFVWLSSVRYYGLQEQRFCRKLSHGWLKCFFPLIGNNIATLSRSYHLCFLGIFKSGVNYSIASAFEVLMKFLL